MIEKTAVVYVTPPGFVIWNLLPVPEGEYVVMEERNDTTRKVTFACITTSGKLLWRNTNLPETWWVNLIHVTQHHVLLRIFENTTNPDVVQTIALNVKNGEQATLPELEHTIDALRPFVYLQGEPEFDTVQKFLLQKLNTNIFLGVEYLPVKDFIFIAYYSGQPAHFTNVLACFRHEGSLLWSEEIGTNLKGMGIGTFFIATNTLFFVKNKTELVTFRIV